MFSGWRFYDILGEALLCTPVHLGQLKVHRLSESQCSSHLTQKNNHITSQFFGCVKLTIISIQISTGVIN